MHPKELEAVIQFGRIGLRVLSERALTYLGFLGCAAQFGVALAFPTWERCAIAAAFAVLVYWPLLKMERSRAVAQQQGGASE